MPELWNPNLAVRLAAELADPIRLAVLDLLSTTGPATASDLANRLGLPAPRLSNHLARLRKAGLVEVERVGRHAVYELSNPFFGELLANLKSVAGAAPTLEASPASSLAFARTCYDHLGGRLGVAVFDALTSRGAFREVKAGEASIDLGPNWQAVFGELGIDVQAARRERRRFAFACLDWSERRPHLGGALGAAVFSRFHELGWIVRVNGTRALALSSRGRRGLKKYLGLGAEALRNG